MNISPILMFFTDLESSQRYESNAIRITSLALIFSLLYVFEFHFVYIYIYPMLLFYRTMNISPILIFFTDLEGSRRDELNAIRFTWLALIFSLLHVFE